MHHCLRSFRSIRIIAESVMRCAWALGVRVGKSEGNSLANHARNAKGRQGGMFCFQCLSPGGILPPSGYLKPGGHSRARESLEFHESATRTWEQELKDIRSGQFMDRPPPHSFPIDAQVSDHLCAFTPFAARHVRMYCSSFAPVVNAHICPNPRVQSGD